MKIIELRAENVKRLKAVAIRPKGHVVEIAGRNGQGKTSVLDSLWWLFAGKKSHQAAPIREGEVEARIQASLGEIIVTRKFGTNRNTGKVTTTLAVETADGARYTSPQEVVSEMVGPLSFDPLAFARMSPTDQYRALQALCDVDVEKADGLNRADYERRTEQNRIAQNRRAQAAAILVPDVSAEEPVSVAELLEEIDGHERQNRENERRRAEREREKERLRLAHEEAVEMRHRASELIEQAALKERSIRNAVRAMEESGPTPADTDTTELRARVADAERINQAVETRRRRDALQAEAEAASQESQRLTEAMDQRKRDVAAQLEEADLPVEGLALADGTVYFRGQPFAQASDAEQLRVSCAMAMRDNAKLRVIRVRDGSLLDDDSMRVLHEMAEQHDYQVWIERVGTPTDGRVAFVIEDGSVVGANQEGDLFDE